MSRGSDATNAGVRRLRRKLREIQLTAGSVLAAPNATSASPTRRRRSAGSRSANNRPSPAASAARVASTNPNFGRGSVTVRMDSRLASRMRTHRGVQL